MKQKVTFTRKYFYFVGKHNSTMYQRINTENARIYGSYQSFQYCLPFSPIDKKIYLYHFKGVYLLGKVCFPKYSLISVISSYYNNISSNVWVFNYWSYCNNLPAGTDYFDLKFIFGYNNTTTNCMAVKDIAIY